MKQKISADEHFEEAMVLLGRGNRPAALNRFEAAIFARPGFAEAYNNRGNALLGLGNVFDAWMCFAKACEINSVKAEYHNNRGAALSEMGRFDGAQEAYTRSLYLNPKSEHALTNLGNVLRQTGEIDKAAEYYRWAIAAAPDHVDAHLGLAMSLLELGEWAEGWREYEWRWRVAYMVKRELPYQEWNGTGPDAAVRALLICSEQGMGDALQFMRYAPLIKQVYGCRVYVEVRQPLVRLARSLLGIDGVIAFGEQPPADVTHWVSMMSLPRICGTMLETVPWPGRYPNQYLHANEWRSQQWQRNLAALPPGPRVGLCWAGRRRADMPASAAIDRRRSLQLGQLAPLAAVPGIGWVSLQMGPPAEQINTQPHGFTIGDWMHECDDFYDTAALVANLDLVITVDTAVAHLAAALGRPTWMLSRFDGCWRWLHGRSDTPWYPTMRIFRQPEPGDWESVVNEVAGELEKFVAADYTELPARAMAR